MIERLGPFLSALFLSVTQEQLNDPKFIEAAALLLRHWVESDRVTVIGFCFELPISLGCTNGLPTISTCQTP